MKWIEIQQLYFVGIKLQLIFAFLCFGICLAEPCNAQVYLKCIIKSEATEEVVVNALTEVLGKNKFGITNQEGCVSYNLERGDQSLIVMHVGYQKDTFQIHLTKDSVIVFSLNPIEVGQVVVNSQQPVHVRTISGKTILNPAYLAQLPSLTAEPDLIKSLLMVPGVLGDNKGFSNYFVRGGGRQNNLVLWDGNPLFLTNHVWGFLSPINMNLVNSVDFYKGGFPARYGGRTASVMDIATRNGNSNSLSGNFCLGVLQSKALLEGPLFIKRTTFILGLRGSYLDLFTLPVLLGYNRSQRGSFFGYTFADASVKITHRFSDRNWIHFSGLYSIDVQRVYEKARYNSQDFNDIFKYSQAQFLGSVTHHYNISSRLHLKSSISYSAFSNKFTNNTHEAIQNEQVSEIQLSSSNLNSLSFKTILTYQPADNHTIKTGFDYSLYQLDPQMIQYSYRSPWTNTDTVFGNGNSDEFNELCAFIEDNWTISPGISIDFGGRLTSYKGMDTSFFLFEPRLSFRWLMRANLSAKIGYSLMNQNLHVLTNKIHGIGSELWLASNNRMLPETAVQFSSGLFGEVSDLNLEYGIELYLKKSKNLIEYPFSEPDEVFGEDFKNLIYTGGEGLAYGLEFSLEFKQDYFQGNMAYTLSWDERSFSQIQGGVYYPFINDRRHNLTAQVVYLISETSSFGANFHISSGTPVTLPIGYFPGNSVIRPYYIFDRYNNYRLPAFHHLDVSYQQTWKSKKQKSYYWGVNIYNLYARKNPVQLYFSQGKVFKVSLFGIIPSVKIGMNF